MVKVTTRPNTILAKACISTVCGVEVNLFDPWQVLRDDSGRESTAGHGRGSGAAMHGQCPLHAGQLPHPRSSPRYSDRRQQQSARRRCQVHPAPDRSSNIYKLAG